MQIPEATTYHSGLPVNEKLVVTVSVFDAGNHTNQSGTAKRIAPDRRSR
jgi:hypothetical protein